MMLELLKNQEKYKINVIESTGFDKLG
jgi:hypothetical protein